MRKELLAIAATGLLSACSATPGVFQPGQANWGPDSSVRSVFIGAIAPPASISQPPPRLTLQTAALPGAVSVFVEVDERGNQTVVLENATQMAERLKVPAGESKPIPGQLVATLPIARAAPIARVSSPSLPVAKLPSAIVDYRVVFIPNAAAPLDLRSKIVEIGEEPVGSILGPILKRSANYQPPLRLPGHETAAARSNAALPTLLASLPRPGTAIPGTSSFVASNDAGSFEDPIHTSMDIAPTEEREREANRTHFFVAPTRVAPAPDRNPVESVSDITVPIGTSKQPVETLSQNKSPLDPPVAAPRYQVERSHLDAPANKDDVAPLSMPAVTPAPVSLSPIQIPPTKETPVSLKEQPNTEITADSPNEIVNLSRVKLPETILGRMSAPLYDTAKPAASNKIVDRFFPGNSDKAGSATLDRNATGSVLSFAPLPKRVSTLSGPTGNSLADLKNWATPEVRDKKYLSISPYLTERAPG
jgi:hypothetical protein